jgi:hypothetical protein
MKKILLIFLALTLICSQVFAAASNEKLANELEEFMRCIDEQSDRLESLMLGLNQKGDQEIRVKIKSSVLLQYPKLLEKFNIKPGSPEAEALLGQTYVRFVVNVPSGKYSFDRSLRSSSFRSF